MPARPINSGTLSFGLVSIPVKLYSATESSGTISFHTLHSKCGTRVKQQFFCPKDNEVVPRNETTKGYEFGKDQYVTFTEEELKAMLEESRKAIEITEFVAASQVDPLYFDGAYYLGPDKGGEKAYRLLAEAMRRLERAALATWISRGRQYLVMLRPVDGGIAMQQLHYSDEIRSFSEVPVGEAQVKENELKLAMELVKQRTSEEFRPKEYRDEVKGRIEQAIQRKVEGQEVTVAAPGEPQAQIIDLMEALKASLAGKAAQGRERRPARPSPRKPAAKRAGAPARASRK